MFILDRKFKTSIIGSAFLLSALAFTACDANETEGAKTVKAAASTATATTKKAVAAATTATGASHTYANGKKVIDGGSTYPDQNGMSGPYHVNPQVAQEIKNIKYGRTATKNEINAWNIDVMPDGTGLPEGKGSVAEGDELYEEKCVICHGDFGSGGGGYPALAKGNAYEGQKTLKNQRKTPDSDGPIRVFGTYWPQASTLWWYIKTGMPHPAPLSLTDDEVYALSAYILSINEMKIDGEDLDDDYVLDRAKFMKIVMPNKDGFEPNIDGPKGPDNVRAYLNDTKNYGNGTRCMKDCTDKVNIVRIKVEMKDALPPMSTVRDLPKEDSSTAVITPGQKTYEGTCAVCHGTDAMGAPVVGNKADWAKVTAKGMDTVYSHAIKGFNGMPAKGGNSNLTDDQVKATVDYMIEKSK